MPIKKAAAKYLRQTKKRQKRNQSEKEKFRALIKKFRESEKKTAKDFQKIQKALDRAVKHKTIPKGRADRLKSRLAKLMKAPAKKKTKAKSKRK